MAVLAAMGVTACTSTKKSSSVVDPGTSAPATSNPTSNPTSKPTSNPTSTSSKSSTSTQPPAPQKDATGHIWGNDADVAASGEGVAYKKATCTEGDNAIRVKVNQSVVTDANRKSGTPEGYLKLNGDGNQCSFKFNYDSYATGKLYLYGVMDGYSSNYTKNAFYVNGTPNVEVKVNNAVVDISAQKDVKFQDIFGTDSDSDNLSNENYALLGDVVLKNGLNEIIYKRVQTLNMLVKDFVFVVQNGTEPEPPVGTWQSDETGHWKAEDKSDLAAHTFEEVTTEAVAPTCTKEGKKVEKCSVCEYVKETTLAKLPHEYTEKVNAYEEDGMAPAEAYKCKNCDAAAIRWAALDYDATSNDIEKNSDNVRLNKCENKNGTAGKGAHLIYKVYAPEAVANAGLAFDIKPSSNNRDLFEAQSDDSSKGYVYNESNELVPATKRYGLFVNGAEVELGANSYGNTTTRGWYDWPVEFALKKGENTIEIVQLGGYRANMYNFQLTGLKDLEHVANYKKIVSKNNTDGKQVVLGEDKYLNNKAIEIAFKDFSTAPANPSGTNPWYLAKNSYAEWKIGVDKDITGAKIYFSLECSSTTHLDRHLFNEAKYNEAHPDAPVALPGQSPDKTTEDDWRYAVAVNGVDCPILNDKTMKESGVKAVNTQTYVYFTDINLKGGEENVIRLTQMNLGYRMKFNQNVRIVFEGDAVITGEHAHEWVLTSDTATCTEAGTATYTCSDCNETKTEDSPAKGHNYVQGQAVANSDNKNVYPIACEHGDSDGLEMAFGDCDGASNIEASGKVKDGSTLTGKFKGAKVGKVAFYACAKIGSGEAAFADGYKLKIGEKEVAATVVGKKLSDFGASTTKAVYFEVGMIEIDAADIDANGEVAISYVFTTQGYRHVYSDMVRIIYQPDAQII